MGRARLCFDGKATIWALLECDHCNETVKFPAFEAFHAAVKCSKCAASIDVHRALLEVAAGGGDPEIRPLHATAEPNPTAKPRHETGRSQRGG